MTERQIQDALYRDLCSAHMLICPNYAPSGWWECDLFSVTKSGYMVEHEIKITVADFKKDAEKRRNDYQGLRGLYRSQETNKHKCLVIGDVRGPSRFYYVAPKGLLNISMIPDFAGLKEVEKMRGGWLRVNEVKKAPVLHRQKPSAEVLTHVAGVFYYRLWSERQRNTGANLATVNEAER